MDALISEFEGNISSSGKEIHILLVGNYQTRRLRKILESEGDSLIISKARNDDEVLASVSIESPDVIIVLTDNRTPIDVFNHTLMTFCRIQMNTRTIIISDNPFKYIRCALKAKVAALLYWKIDNHDLVPIIHEISTWSHGQPIPGGILSMDNQPVPETESGGE
jgi:DNA-binding NarL/FixJ family response regulator